MGNEPIEGDEQGTYLVLKRTKPTECGIAYSPQGAWRQSHRTSRRSHDLPGRAGKRHTGRRVAGGTCHNRMELEGREMRKPFLILTAMRCFSGKPSALKGACSVWERGVGNVLTTRVRDRRVPVANALASHFGNEVTR